MLLVNCSNCRAQLQLPPRTATIRCSLCHTVTRVADSHSRSIAPPTCNSHYSPQPHYQLQQPRPPSSSTARPPRLHRLLGPLGHHGGRKKAVICGINYKDSKSELDGCINDAKCFEYLLINRFKFLDSDILMLTEEESDPSRIPTRQNIMNAMAWLVAGVRAGDSLVFYYSGHGGQQINYNGDEPDGFDETLCPLDYETSGEIVDDEINDTIVKPIPRGAKLTAVIDACHSGTVLDLPFLCRMKNKSGQYVWEDHRPKPGRWKGTNGGEAISFSGCDDDQLSSDTSGLSKVTYTGAMTYSFIQAIEGGHASTYGSMLNAMRNAIRNANKMDLAGSRKDVFSSLLTMFLTGGGSSRANLRQEPQLSANEPFDVYARPFSL